MGCCGTKGVKDDGGSHELRATTGTPSSRRLHPEAAPRQRRGSSDKRRVAEKIGKAEKTKILNLEDEGLAQVPEAVCAIEGLRALKIGQNGLTDLPMFPASAASLKKLHVAHNCIAVLPQSLAFPALTLLDVAHNALTSLPDLSALTSLKELDAGHNHLTSVAPLPPGLQTLKLPHNQLDVVPAVVFALKGLHELDLCNNKLKSVGEDGEVSQLEGLKSLDVSHNAVSALPESLFVATSLNSLEITGNPLQELDLRSMPCYDTWLKRKASTINKKIQGGATYDLIKN